MVKIKFFDILFGKSIKEERVPAIELKEWLEYYSAKKLKSINKGINDASLKFNTQLQTAKELLGELENSELMNKEITPREIHLMQGNRESYIKKLNLFLDENNFPDKDFQVITEFCQNFHGHMDVLNSGTHRSYYILKNFFDKEMVAIAQCLKTCEDLVLRAEEILESSEVGHINALNKKTYELNEAIIKSDALKKQLSDHQEKMREVSDKRTQVKDKMESMGTSSEYKDFNDNIQEKEHNLKNRAKIADELSLIFSEIRTAAISFQKSEGVSQILEDYLDRPVDAIIKDDNYDILHKLSEIRAKIKDKTLEVNDKKKNKILAAIDKVDREFLLSKRAELKNIDARLKEINTTLEKASVSMNFKELEYQLEHFNAKMENMEKEISALVKAEKSLEIEKQMDSLERQIFEITGVQVTIAVQNSDEDKAEVD